MTYVLMSLPFLVVAAGVLVATHRRRGVPVLSALGLALAVLLVLTAAFDNIMISVGLVAYGEAQRLGWSVGVAPVEDFTYTIAGALLLPAVWHLLGGTVGRTPSGAPRGPDDDPSTDASTDFSTDPRGTGR